MITRVQMFLMTILLGTVKQIKVTNLTKAFIFTSTKASV